MANLDNELVLAELKDLLVRLGGQFGFDVRKEVEASESAWVDLVWFDRKLPVGDRCSNMRFAPVLPIVGFEIEWGTGLNAKHVKGSVSNLNNLGAQLGVIVIAQHNVIALGKQPPYKDWNQPELEKILRDRVYRWVYAEARAQGRVIVMSEREVISWAAAHGCRLNSLPQEESSPFHLPNIAEKTP